MNKTLKTTGFSFIATILLCLSFINSSSQNSKPVSKIYLEAATGGGTYNSYSADLGLKMVFGNKWSMNLGYKYVEMNPKNQPSDYRAETGYLLFIPYTYEVQSEMSMVSLTAGKYLNLGKNIWSTMEGGLSYVSGEKVNFKTAQQSTSNVIIFTSTSSNYTTTKEKKSGIGAMMQADINWAFASFMGLGAGVYANVNSVQSPIGFNIKLLVGKMGKEKKRK